MSSSADAQHPLQVGNVVSGGQVWRVATRLQSSPGAEVPLLLCNGIGTNWELFRPLIAALHPHPVVAFDVPGVGASPAAPSGYTLGGLARQVGQLLTSLGVEQFDVLGVSWGGALAQELAWQLPQRCRRIVLAATSPGVGGLPGKLSALVHLMNARRLSGADHAAEVLPDVYGGRTRRHPAVLREYLRHLTPPSDRGYRQQAFAIAGWSSLWWLPLLPQSVLILAGRDDPLVPLENARLMHRLLRKSQLHVIDDGHLFLHTQAPHLAPLIAGFLG